MKNCVYILRCKNGRYYIGSTKDLSIRLECHFKGGVHSTKYLRPLELVFACECSNVTVARQLEYKLKRQKDRSLIERIIQTKIISF